MNYPLGEAILSFAGGRHIDMRVVAQHYELGANVRPEDGPAFARRLEHVLSVYDPEVTAVQLNLLDSHDMPRVLSVFSGDTSALRLATLLQMTCRARRRSTTATRSGWPARWTRTAAGRCAGTSRPGTTHCSGRCRAPSRCGAPNPALRRGTLRVVGAEGGACAFVRADDAATFLVAVNAGDAELGLEVGLPEVAGRALAPIAWDGPATAGIRIPDDGRVRVTLPAREALVFRTEP